MRNLHSRSATQPDLDDIGNLVRFKGCYFLKELKSIQTDNHCPQRVALITDVEGTGKLELRLLGDHFTDLKNHIGEYISIEAAVRHYNRGYFFYLAWYDLFHGTGAEQAISKAQNEAQKQDKKDIHKALFQRATHITDDSIKSFCLSLLLDANKSIANQRVRESLLSRKTLNDAQFCVELTYLIGKDKEVSFVGKKLSSIKNQTPFILWERQLLGD